MVRSIPDILARVHELTEWDVTGVRQMELLRFVPDTATEPRASVGRHRVRYQRVYTRDRDDRGTAGLGSAKARALYLLDTAAQLWAAPERAQREEARSALRRAEQAAWVAGLDDAVLSALRSQHGTSPALVQKLRAAVGEL